jgi:hypothetical protein
MYVCMSVSAATTRTFTFVSLAVVVNAPPSFVAAVDRSVLTSRSENEGKLDRDSEEQSSFRGIDVGSTVDDWGVVWVEAVAVVNE